MGRGGPCLVIITHDYFWPLVSLLARAFWWLQVGKVRRTHKHWLSLHLMRHEHHHLVGYATSKRLEIVMKLLCMCECLCARVLVLSILFLHAFHATVE